jgi:hypothetical protein
MPEARLSAARCAYERTLMSRAALGCRRSVGGRLSRISRRRTPVTAMHCRICPYMIKAAPAAPLARLPRRAQPWGGPPGAAGPHRRGRRSARRVRQAAGARRAVFLGCPIVQLAGGGSRPPGASHAMASPAWTRRPLSGTLAPARTTDRTRTPLPCTGLEPGRPGLLRRDTVPQPVRARRRARLEAQRVGKPFYVGMLGIGVHVVALAELLGQVLGQIANAPGGVQCPRTLPVH